MWLLCILHGDINMEQLIIQNEGKKLFETGILICCDVSHDRELSISDKKPSL